MTAIKQVRRKSEPRAAAQFVDKESGSAILNWANSEMIRMMVNEDDQAYRIDIASFDKMTQEAIIGDWVVMNEDGSFDVIKGEEFLSQFEEI